MLILNLSVKSKPTAQWPSRSSEYELAGLQTAFAALFFVTSLSILAVALAWEKPDRAKWIIVVGGWVYGLVKAGGKLLRPLAAE